MKKHRRTITVAVLLAMAAVGLVAIVKTGEPTFRGKPESYWITNIVYNGSSAQLDQWRSFGPEGVHFLAQYMDRDSGSRRGYRKFYELCQRKAPFPSAALKLLPTPVETRATRMSVLNLLDSLASRDTNAARIAEPSIARAMTDENAGLRQLAVGAYESVILRGQIKPTTKIARLTEFLRLAEDDDHWVRGNAAVALRYFPEEAPTVTPVLVKILPEPHPHIQLTIARSLVAVDPASAANAGVARIAAELMRNPEQAFSNQSLQRWSGWEISRQAAEVLGELHSEPKTSLPALIEGLSSTNREVAIASFRALTKFKEQTEETLPPLRKAAVERNDIPNWVKAELHSIDPAGKVAK